MNKPKEEILSDLFHSEEWQALKQEINVCLDNASRELKRRGGIQREFSAGECTAYEQVLGLENKYKDIKVSTDV